MRLKAAAKGLSNFKIKICTGRGGSRIFSRGGGGRIFKKNSKILTAFFLGRPNRFSKAVKRRFWHLLENFDRKIALFWRDLPLKNSISWRL